MSPQAKFDEIAENLGFLDDWEDRYRYIIELGQALAPIEDEERTAENRVNGCVSQVWLVSESTQEGEQTILHFKGDSDAMIVKGLVAIMVALYSDRSATEIAQTDAIARLDELGLREHLSTQRSNGLVAMVDRMRDEARSRL